MKSAWCSIALALCLSAPAHALQLLDRLSFGRPLPILSGYNQVNGWRILGGADGQLPEVSSNKIVLSPLYPGNRRGALWSEDIVSVPEWTAEFEFRTSGPEKGSGNLQMWYTKDGVDKVGTASIYTVNKFDGLVLVVDTHGGKGGTIRGFLNDGSLDYSSHHGVDGLAFGHCDYPYRNLERTSVVKVRHMKDNFEVIVDDKLCFGSNKITLPQGYNFGISAASADTPDSFEAYRFSVITPDSYASQQQYGGGQYQAPPTQNYASPQDTTASSIAGSEQQFADLHDRLQTLQHGLDILLNEVAGLHHRTDAQQRELLDKTASTTRLNEMDTRVKNVEKLVQEIKRDVSRQDYGTHFTKLHDTLKDTQANLVDHLPQTLGEIVTTSSPRMGFFLFIVVVVQLALAGSYVVYKKRRANAPKKFL